MWEGMPYMRQHLLRYVTWASTSVHVFAQPVNHLSDVSYAFMLSYWETTNTVKSWELASVPQLQLTLIYQATNVQMNAEIGTTHKYPDTPRGFQSFWSLMLSIKETVVTVFKTNSTHKGLWSPKLSASICWNYQAANCDTSSEHISTENVSPTHVQNSGAYFRLPL